MTRRAPAARAVVDRRRDLPAAQRADARAGSRAARRSAPESSLVKLFWADVSQRLSETATRARSCAHGRRDVRSRRALGARPAVDARQLDHGRHERDPAQHHRRAPARPASGAQVDGHRSGSTSSIPRATRGAATRTTCGRGCAPRRRSRAFEPPGYKPFWAITKHADIMQIASQPLRFSSAQGITLAAPRRRAGAAAGDPRHARSAAARADAPGRRARASRRGRCAARRERRRAHHARRPRRRRGERAPRRVRLRRADRRAVPARSDRVDPRRAEQRLGAAVPLDQRGDRKGRSRVPAAGRDAGPDDQAGAGELHALPRRPHRAASARTARTIW